MSDHIGEHQLQVVGKYHKLTAKEPRAGAIGVGIGIVGSLPLGSMALKPAVALGNGLAETYTEIALPHGFSDHLTNDSTTETSSPQLAEARPAPNHNYLAEAGVTAGLPLLGAIAFAAASSAIRYRRHQSKINQEVSKLSRLIVVNFGVTGEKEV